jgi:ankyrin repeat protein
VVVSEDADALEYWAEAGAEIATLADHNGRTALHVAVANGLYDHVMVLLNYGANPLLPDSAGSTPLDEATQRNDSEMIQLLERKVLTSRCSSVSGGTNCE